MGGGHPRPRQDERSREKGDADLGIGKTRAPARAFNGRDEPPLGATMEPGATDGTRGPHQQPAPDL